MKNFLFSFALVFNACIVKTTTIDTPEVYRTHHLGFSQAVAFNGVVYGSGQVGWDQNFKLPEDPTFDNQFEQTLINIELLLQKQGCGWQDILHLRFYIVDLNEAKVKRIGGFLKTTYPNKYAPATTLLGVSALAKEQLQIEIEFIAKNK